MEVKRYRQGKSVRHERWSSSDRVVRFVMSWLPKRDKLDPVQASAIDFAVA